MEEANWAIAWILVFVNLECDRTDCACHKASFLHKARSVAVLLIEIPKCASYAIKGFASFKRVPRSKFHDVAPECLTFAIVRNPYDRIVSNFAMFTQSRKGHIPKQPEGKTDQERFESFLQITREIKNHHWAPMVHYLPRDARGVVDLGLINVVCRLETLEHDFAPISRILGQQKPLPVSNSSNRKPYAHYYTDRTRKIVEEIYGEDIERFRYRF